MTLSSALCYCFVDVFPTLLFVKNAVLALQIFCMMDRWMCGRKLVYARTDKRTSSAFLCSFVLVSKTIWSDLKQRYDSIIFLQKNIMLDKNSKIFVAGHR